MTPSAPVIAAAPEGEATLSWDLIPDERAPSPAIVMQFPSYQAAHATLTAAGFAPTSEPAQVARHDPATAVRYAHPDGSTVVLARQLADTAMPFELAAVGG